LITTNPKESYVGKQLKINNLEKNNGWKISETNNFSELQHIGPNGTPLYYTTFCDNVNEVSRVTTMHDNGILYRN